MPMPMPILFYLIKKIRRIGMLQMNLKNEARHQASPLCKLEPLIAHSSVSVHAFSNYNGVVQLKLTVVWFVTHEFSKLHIHEVKALRFCVLVIYGCHGLPSVSLWYSTEVTTVTYLANILLPCSATCDTRTQYTSEWVTTLECIIWQNAQYIADGSYADSRIHYSCI